MRLSYYIFAIISLVSFTNFTHYDEKSDPILTRHDKDEGEFLKLALQFKKYVCHLNLPDCEGTIIADRWAISAAHCSLEIREKLESGNKHFVMVNGAEIEVDQVIIHPEWSKDGAYDIALLHLKNKPRDALKAAIYSNTDEENKIVYLVGKGDKGNGLDGIGDNDGKLRAATNIVEEATDYWLKWTFDNPDQPNDNLTEYEGISGPGDSGGPAFILKDNVVYIAGISSAQNTRNSGGIEGLYGVREYYVRLSQYHQWINQKIKKNKS